MRLAWTAAILVAATAGAGAQEALSSRSLKLAVDKNVYVHGDTVVVTFTKQNAAFKAWGLTVLAESTRKIVYEREFTAAERAAGKVLWNLKDGSGRLVAPDAYNILVGFTPTAKVPRPVLQTGQFRVSAKPQGRFTFQPLRSVVGAPYSIKGPRGYHAVLAFVLANQTGANVELTGEMRVLRKTSRGYAPVNLKKIFPPPSCSLRVDGSREGLSLDIRSLRGVLPAGSTGELTLMVPMQPERDGLEPGTYLVNIMARVNGKPQGFSAPLVIKAPAERP